MLASVVVIAYVILVVVGLILLNLTREMKAHRDAISSALSRINNLDKSKADRRRGRPAKIPTSPDHVKAPEPWPEPSGEESK